VLVDFLISEVLSLNKFNFKLTLCFNFSLWVLRTFWSFFNWSYVSLSSICGFFCSRELYGLHKILLHQLMVSVALQKCCLESFVNESARYYLFWTATDLSNNFHRSWCFRWLRMHFLHPQHFSSFKYPTSIQT